MWNKLSNKNPLHEYLKIFSNYNDFYKPFLETSKNSKELHLMFSCKGDNGKKYIILKSYIQTVKSFLNIFQRRKKNSIYSYKDDNVKEKIPYINT